MIHGSDVSKSNQPRILATIFEFLNFMLLLKQFLLSKRKVNNGLKTSIDDFSYEKLEWFQSKSPVRMRNKRKKEKDNH